MIEVTANNTTEYRYSSSFTYGIVIGLGLAAIIGILGNILLVIIITKARKLRSVMNRFILHLAIGDLIVCIICIPLFLAINFYPVTNHVITCKISRFLQYLAPQGTIMLLITIGINRHQAIVHPLRGMTYQKANILIFGAWLYSVIMVAPSLYLTELKFYRIPHLNTTRSYCATIPVSTVEGLGYVVALAFFGYLIPLIALVVLYSKISCSVWRRNNKLRTSRPEAAVQRSRQKVIKMFLTVILVFIVTWVPLIIYVGVLESYLGGAKRISYVRLSLYAIGLSNSVYNPFIYSFFNKRFRDGCKSLFKGYDTKPTQRRSGGGRREAVRENKNESYVVNVQGHKNPQPVSPELDWSQKFNQKALRGHESIFESPDNVKLLTLKDITLAEKQSDDTETLPNSSETSIRDFRENEKKETNGAEKFDNLRNGHDTPSGSMQTLPKYVSHNERKRKIHKTFSIDPTLMKRRKPSFAKLRKTLSHDEKAQLCNDFENIF